MPYSQIEPCEPLPGYKRAFAILAIAAFHVLTALASYGLEDISEKHCVSYGTNEPVHQQSAAVR